AAARSAPARRDRTTTPARPHRHRRQRTRRRAGWPSRRCDSPRSPVATLTALDGSAAFSPLSWDRASRCRTIPAMAKVEEPPARPRKAARPATQGTILNHLSGRVDPLTSAILVFPLFIIYQ